MAEWNIDPAQAGMAGVLGTAILAWLGNRLVGKAAIQTAVTAQFHELMGQMRQELRVALRERDKARARNAELEGDIEELTATIRAMELRIADGTRPPYPDFQV